ncbi:hypothetical protein VTI74DRAFT_2087 [Chaetomium olivicolor]
MGLIRRGRPQCPASKRIIPLPFTIRTAGNVPAGKLLDVGCWPRLTCLHRACPKTIFVEGNPMIRGEAWISSEDVR